MGILKNIQDKVEAKRKEIKNKKLIAKLKAMTDDELLDFIDDKKEAVVEGDSEVKATVAKAIAHVEESEKQIQILTETDIKDELTGSQKTAIMQTIDSEVLLKDQKAKDLISDLPKNARYDIVQKLVTNQEIKASDMSLQEIERSVNAVYRIINYTNDWNAINYIYVTKLRIKELLAMSPKDTEITEEEATEINKRKKQARPINRKLVAMAAKKVVSNYKELGNTMRIMEFMNVALPLNDLGEDIDVDVENSGVEIEEMLKRAQKEYFLKQVEKESSEEMKSIIEKLLEEEEQRAQRGKLAKLKRDAGDQTVQQIADIAQNTDLLEGKKDDGGRED